jgi:AmmeMemoRadiSam system protein B
MGLPLLRRAAVAGSWYSSDPRMLAEEVDEYLAAAPLPSASDSAPIAIVSPHAGLMYSGPVAAHAYRLLAGRDIDVVVLVGPSHYVGFEGVAVYPSGAFETPLGPMLISSACADAIAAASPLVRESGAPHAREHSLEMQLPFLKRVLPNAEIVPLVMGHQKRDTVDALGKAIADAVAGLRVVLVASTDLSHFQDATRAAKLDGRVLDHLAQFDADGLMMSLEKFPEHACGGGPTVSVMRAAQRLGAREGRVLKYGDSGDVSGDKSAVVGYVAAAFGTFA